jgi:hypothetical protein
MDHLDEENEETQELTFDELYPDEEIDDETLNIIYSRVNDLDDNIDFITKPVDKKKKKKEKNSKDNQIITLADLIKENDNKNKKWTSQRIENKKGKENKEINVTSRRKFNPRLPKYEYYKKESKEIKMLHDDINFPHLK